MAPPRGGITPTEQWGANDYNIDAHGYSAEPEFDHNAAKDKINQYRREAAARRRRQMKIAEKKALQMRAELEKESEVMAKRQADRESELKARRDERYQKQAEERRLRQEEREAKLRKKASSPKRKPLYLQMEEQFRQKEAHEEARRRETLKSQRAKFEPVDFAELGKEADEMRRQHKQEWEARRKDEKRQPLKHLMEVAESSPPPPDRMRNLYRGKTHQRIVQEDLAKASTREAVRSKAQARRDASLRYARLVSELSHDEGSAAEHGGAGGRAVSNPAERFSAPPAISRTGFALALTPNGSRKQLSPGDASREPVDMKALGAAASALNKQVREKEEQVQMMRAAAGSPTAGPSDELIDNHVQLSQLYVKAIRAKLDLFEGLAGTGESR